MNRGWDDPSRKRDADGSEMVRAGLGAAPVGPIVFRVPSSTGGGFYRVSLESGAWRCECPDWLDRRQACKHVFDVLRSLDPNPAARIEFVVGPTKRKYRQNWPAYDASKQAFDPFFDVLVADLLEQIEEPPRRVGMPGRPALPLRTQYLIALHKVRLGMGAMDARGMMVARYSHGMGTLSYVPNYQVASRLFNRPSTTAQLLHLIRFTASVLADLEEGGTIAVDSTGFCTTCRGSYCTEHHDPSRRHAWVKAHLVIGVHTHLVLAVRITDESGADAPQFLPLLREVFEAGVRPGTVVADKGYLSRENYSGAASLGLDPFIPFKVNSRPEPRGSPLWAQKFYQFHARKQEFEDRYHLRSNVESVNSAIKRVLGEELYSHKPLARMNELLAKILVYNIRIIVEESFLSGSEDPAAWMASKAPSKDKPGFETGTESSVPGRKGPSDLKPN